MYFPLSDLPLELALEILRLAASVDVHQQYQSRHQVYQTAISLAQVSHNVRQVVMPHLLHTVILDTQNTVNLFIRSLEQQKHFATTGSRLRLDYTHHVRRFWSTRCWEPIVQQSQDHFRNYRILYDIFCKAETLGFNFDSLHLLYEVLGGAYSGSLPRWNCKRVTFAGRIPRWNPLTSTSAGLSFLKHLTHLTIWVPANDTIGPESDSQIPNWIQRVPFELMPNLTHFAISLVTTPGATTTPILVYTLPARSPQGSTIFSTWATSADPFAYGHVFNLDVGYPPSVQSIPDLSWEMAYLKVANDIWPLHHQIQIGQ